MNRIPDEQREVALDLIYDRRKRGLRPADRVPRPVRGRRRAGLAPVAGSTRCSRCRSNERLSRRIIDGEKKGLDADLDAGDGRGPAAARHRQRHAAVRHEGRRRALRLRRDAAAVRAAVRRGHEDRGRLPRAAHGEGRGPGGQGQDRPRHGQGRRPRHRQEPRRHHLEQQRLLGRQHRHQAAGDGDPRGGRGAPGRRDRHERPARQEHGRHEGEPAGDELPRDRHRLPGDPRRCGADARLRRERPRRGVRRRRPLRPRRLRGPAADGPADGREARRGHARGERGAEGQGRGARGPGTPAPRRSPRRAPPRRSTKSSPGGRSDVATDNTIPTPPFWGSRITKGIALADYASWIDERALFLGQWGLRGSRAGAGPSYEELVETEGRPRLRDLLSAGSRPRGSCRPPSCTATSRRSARTRT